MNRIARPVPISFVQFGALTASEWQAYAPVEITRPSNRGNQDPKGTPYDIGLGAMANGSICGTCGLDNSKCPGHFGRIHLEEPVYNPIYIDVVLGIFKSICIWCSAPRISREGAGALLSLDRNKRFKAYKKKAESIKQCYSRTCNKPLPYFFIDKSYIKYYYDLKDDNTTISAREAMGILMQITPDTTDLLGFNHALSSNPAFLGEDKDLPQEKHHVHETPPEAFIYAILPVSPTCSRPWVIKGSGKDEERKDDDITDRYNTIIKLNIKLKSDKDTSIEDIPIKGRRKTDKLTDSERIKIKEDLNAAIWSIHDNTSTKDKAKNNSRKHKGLCNRLAGKEGQIQSNIAGKRSDFTARTVIVGGGRYLRLDEIGVPESFTKILTSPEHVLDWNIKALEKLLDEGKINTVYRQGNTIDVKSVTDNGKKPFIWKNQKGLREGDIVHRHLRKGDVGMFNRQPSLRIESIQGVKVFPLKNELVFRVPLGVTRPYNADFDGDECNLHIPQSQGARAECATFSRMAYHIVSAQNNAPVIGCVQNTLVITFILTETFLTPEATDPNQPPNYKFPDGVLGYQTMISKADFMDAIVQADIPMEHYNNFIVRVAKYYPEYVVKKPGGITLKSFIPGKIVVSIVFPPTFTWSRLTHTNERLPLVEIKDGIIQPNSGPLCSKAIGGKPHSSVHPLWKESPDLAVDFISHLQFMTVIFVTRLGFSIGISDCIATDTTEVKHKLSEASIKCELINSSTKSAADKEIEINGVLNETMSVAPRLAKTGMNKKDRNAVVIMKKAGAKGSDINNGQIAGFVGQQNLDGKRIPQMLSNGRRTLPSIKIGDNSPEAKGFVKHSYLEGLSAQEAWFHAMGGRRGVVDTAMKSVTYETEILITRGASSTPQIIQIGEFIDNLLKEHPEDIENHEDRNMELLALEENIHIPTTDEIGNVTWAPVTAVTRHDPGLALYKITTRGGRSVIVTESKSLLVWNDAVKQLIETNGGAIKIGDKVPVTLNLPHPPIIHAEMSMVKYLPPSEFIYGTELHKCYRLIKAVTTRANVAKPSPGVGKTPPGWWNLHSGKDFTVPYSHVHSILRTFKRTATQFEEGYIYPFVANRVRSKIPETFIFDKSNGFFIGLYLAEGHSNIHGNVCITNNDSELQQKTIQWYERYNMNWDTYSRDNTYGKSTTIRAFSTVMATFLINWLGKDSYTKKIPDEIYSAPDDFICGLLDGYICGDGTVGRNGEIVVSSASDTLISGVSILCARLGIFTKITHSTRDRNNLGTVNIAPIHILSIRAEHAYTFANKVGCSHKLKFARLRTEDGRYNNSKPVFPSENDIILDPIEKIERINTANHPHVYDLTVPSTTNFGLANGLHVVDTAHSGYIQKRSVNAVNNFKVNHDATVRDSNGGIVQFTYGGDGLNGKERIFCEEVGKYLFVNPIHIAGSLNSKAEADTQPGVKRTMLKEEVDELLKNIIFTCAGKETEITKRVTYNTRVCLRQAISSITLYECIIPDFCFRIRNEYEQAKVKNGYMAGLVASSSIGEPTTQLSQLKDEKIPLMVKRKDGQIEYLLDPIGEAIDGLFEECPILFELGPNSIAGYPDVEVYVHTVDPDTSKTEWKRVQEISRHPANGKLIEVTTKSGRKTTTTLAHSHLTRCITGKIKSIKGSDLKVGTFIPVCGKLDKIVNINKIIAEDKTFPLDFDVGWIFGAYLSEGHINNGQIGITNITPEFKERCERFAKRFGGKIRQVHSSNKINNSEKEYPGVTTFISGCAGFGRYVVETCKAGSENKHIPGFSLFAPDVFVSGLLRGYLDGDGNVNGSRQLIRVHSVSRDLIEGIALLLSRFGIFGTIGIEKPDRILPLYCYRILRKHAQLYFNHVGTDHPDKLEELNKILEYNNREVVHSLREDIDVIPDIGDNIMNAARPLKLPGYSRNYGRYKNKKIVGKETLKKYIALFENSGASGIDIDIMKIAADADIIWDEIVSLSVLDDPKTLVYDLGVAGNHTFMMQSGIFTHNTLNTFHNAGNSAKDVTLGVPRLTEILNATKKPSKPSCIVYLEDQELKDTLEARRQLQADIKNAGVEGEEVEGLKREVEALDKKSLYKITKLGSNLTYYTVEHFIKEHELRYLSIGESQTGAIGSPLGLLTYEEYEPKWWVKLASDLGNAPKFKPQSWVILLYLNMDNLYGAQITVEDIAIKIEEHSFGQRGYAMTCVASPNVCGQIEVYINFAECAKYIESQIELPRGDDSSDEEDESSDRHLVTSDNIDYFVARDVAMSIIKNTPVQGIDGITRCYVRQEVASGEWVVDTQGSNLMELLGTPGIDATRTISDNMWEILRVLGIEATRTFLSPEIIKILSFDGTYVDGRHPQLMADSMLRSGTITGVNRDGIPRDVGPIAKGMFEKPIENLAEASAFGEHDKVKGVHSSVMFGTLAEVGSGTVDIKDSERLPIKKKIIKGGKGT